jgi:hypothetical protein
MILNFANLSALDVTGVASNLGYWAMNNISFTSAVPEPSGILPLLLIGGAILLASRRQRHRRAIP